MIVTQGDKCKSGSETVSVQFKSSQFVAPQTFELSEALELAYASPEFHFGTRFFAASPSEITDATPFRYWCVIDFDDAEQPERALKECFEFVLSELRPRGLQQDRHFALCVSGTKGAKIFFRHLPHATSDAPRIWHTFLSQCNKRWPTLDTQVAFHSTLRGPWSRHPKQRDRYQVVISKAAGILARDPQWCMRQAQNPERPAFGEWRRALPTLEDPPPAFLALWQAAEDAWLKEKIAQGPKRPRPSYGRRGTDVPAILDSNGIGYREGNGLNGERYFRLTRCIFCGARSKAAIKERSLFYDCYRQSCTAGSGLNFTDWTAGLEVPPRYSGKASGVYTRTLDLRSRKAGAPLPLVKARHVLFEEISKAIDEREGTTLVSCTPGLGKTHSTLAVVADRLASPERPKVVIACQTKELALELRNRSVEFSIPATFKRVVLEGRNDENCSFSRQVAAIGSLGWSPGKAFCAGCPYHGTCRYYRGVRDAADKRSLVFTTHEQAIAMIDAGQVKADVVVFDEDPFRAVHQPYKVGIREIRKASSLFFDEVVDSAHLLAFAMNIASEEMPEDGQLFIQGQRLIEVLDRSFGRAGIDSALNWRDLFVAGASFAEAVEPAGGKLAGASSSEIRALTPRSFFWLLEELVRECDRGKENGRKGWNPTTRIVVRADGVVFWEIQRRARPRSFMPHLILDAYGDPTLYERLLGVPIKDVKVESDLSRSSWYYVPVRSSRDALSDKESAAWKEMDRVMKELQKAGSVLVGTYLAFSEAIRERYKCEVFHFGRGRGIDAYKSCRSVVLFGVPQPPKPAVIERASFFFQEDELAISDEVDPKNRRLFSDFRVQKTLDSMREAEASQLVHRVRPAIESRTIVSIGLVDYPDLPVPEPFPRRKDQAHIEAMEAWVREWYATHGWFTPALIGEGVCPIPPIPRAGPVWKRIFGSRGVSLSPHPTLSARRVWGDRDKAREWVRAVAKEQGIAHWDEL